METNPVKCLICNVEFSNNRKLSKHLKYIHNTSTEQYFCTYIQSRPKCNICGNPVKFKSFNEGFSECCQSRTCGAINYRKKLKLDTNKYNSFVDKVSNNMRDLWKNDQSIRIDNMTKAINLLISNMSKEERIEKYCHLNKLSKEDRTIFIEKLLQTGCHQWWKFASESEKQIVYDKRWKTLSQNIKGTTNKIITFSDNEMEKMNNILIKIFDI